MKTPLNTLLLASLLFAASLARPATVQAAPVAQVADPISDALNQARAIIIDAVGVSGYNTLINVLGADPIAVADLITHSGTVMSLQEIIDAL